MMADKVTFYQLTRKFVDEKDAPPEIKELEYYALAIGHHVGVVDCLSAAMEMPHEEFAAWISKLPPREGRRKLEGVTKWSEIEINKDHCKSIMDAFLAGSDIFNPQEKEWAETLLKILRAIEHEPAIYLMVRRS